MIPSAAVTIVAAVTAAILGSIVTDRLSEPDAELPQIVEYSVTSTTVDSNSSLKRGLVSDLDIRIGGAEVDWLVVHSIVIQAKGETFVDSSDLAIDFANPAVLFGNINTLTPSSAHKVSCVPSDIVNRPLDPLKAAIDKLRATNSGDQPVPEPEPETALEIGGVVCKVGPIDSTGPYVVTLATGLSSVASVSLPAPGIVFRERGEPPQITSSDHSEPLFGFFLFGIVSFVLGAICAVVLFFRSNMWTSSKRLG